MELLSCLVNTTLRYTGSTTHRMHHDGSHAHVHASSGMNQGCPLSPRGFAAVVDPISRFIVSETHRLLDSGAKLWPTWTIGIFGSKRNTSQWLSNTSRAPPEPSTFSCSPPRSRSGEHRVQIPSHQPFRAKPGPLSNAWVPTYASWATAKAAQWSLANRAHHEHSHAQIPEHLSSIILDSMRRQ